MVRLSARGVPEPLLFNPIVEHWDEAAQRHEDTMKADPEVMMIYYLGDTQEKSGKDGSPFLSFYSLHEATMSLYDAPERTVVVFETIGLAPRAVKRLLKVYVDLKKRFPEAPIFESLQKVEDWLVEKFSNPSLVI